MLDASGSLQGLAAAFNAHVDRADSMPVDSPLCAQLRARLAWPLRAQSVDFCCEHWRAILRRRKAVEASLIFEPSRRRRAAAAAAAAAAVDAVSTLAAGGADDAEPQPGDPVGDDDDSDDRLPVVHAAAASSADLDHPLLLDDASSPPPPPPPLLYELDSDSYDTLPLESAMAELRLDDHGDDDDDEDDGYDDPPEAAELPHVPLLPPPFEDDSFADTSVWSVADNYDDYESYQAELDHPDPAAAAAAAAAVAPAAPAVTADGFEHDDDDDGEVGAPQFEPEDERRKIRLHQIFNPAYRFGSDDLTDARVYFARANVLSHYVYQHVTAESSSDASSAVLTRRYLRAWVAACVSSELYASAAVCRARLAGCECMNVLASVDPLAPAHVQCVCDELDRDWALAFSPALPRAPLDETTPNRSHRNPIQMVDIHKEWGALLTAAARLVSYIWIDINNDKKATNRYFSSSSSGSGGNDNDVVVDGDDDDDSDQEEQFGGTGTDLQDTTMWLSSPPSTAKFSSSEEHAGDVEATIELVADQFDTDANDDVSVPNDLKFVALESHWLDSQGNVGAASEATTASTTTATKLRRRSKAKGKLKKKASEQRVLLDEYGVPTAASDDVTSLLRIAVHQLVRGHQLSVRQQQALRSATASIEGQIGEAEERRVRYGDVVDADLETLQARLRRSKARESHALHRQVSLLFCLGDVLCDVARLATGDEFELLFACASAHYGEVAGSGVHVALALDYQGATLDTWAREVLGRCVATFQRESEESRADDAEAVARVNRLSERASWADVRRLFVAARDRFARALADAPDDVVVPVHWGQSLQAEANERRGETAVVLLSACIVHLERAAAARPNDGFVLRCLGDARVDIGKAMRRLAGDDDSGLMRCAQIAALDNDSEPIATVRSVRRLTIFDESDESVTRAELGVTVAFERERGSLRRESVRMLQAADDAYRAAVLARPQYTVAMNNHGLALSTLAKWTSDAGESDALFQRSYDLFARISEPLTPSTYHCQSNYAMTLAAQARILQWRGDAVAARRRLRMATAKLRPLLLKGDAWASFCMARVHAVAGRAEQCRVWLTRCAHRNYLGRATPSQLAFFDSVRECAWFAQMLARARAAEGQHSSEQPSTDDNDANNDDDEESG